MSVKELQALTQQFADAFDQRHLQPILNMLSEDVEVFDHVPYRFDGKALFAKYLNEIIASLPSAPDGAPLDHRKPKPFSWPHTTPPLANLYQMVLHRPIETTAFIRSWAT